MEKHTKKELIEIAKSLNIKYSTMDKKGLIDEIEKVKKQQVIQKVFNNPNLRQIIFKKVANATKKIAGIQNFDGTIIHNNSLKNLPSWMIPKKESKANVLEAWKSKMKNQIYTSQKKQDLSIILDLFRTINVLQTEYKESYEDNWRKEYNNANSQKKINMVSNLLKYTNLHQYYELYDSQEIRNNKGILLNIKTNKTEKFRKITSVLPNLILFSNGNVKTTNVAKQYYKLLLNVPLNASDENRLNKSDYYFLFNKLQTKT